MQAVHNGQIANNGNVSASLDPKQQPNDANEQLIKGAELAAAGRTLGMSEEETLAAVSRQFRRQKRADQNVKSERCSASDDASCCSITADVGGGELKGVGYKGEDDVAFAFGEDIDYNRETGSTRADDSQTYRDNDRGFTTDEETGLVRRETFDETRGEEVKMAPKSALRDALSDLNRTEAA